MGSETDDELSKYAENELKNFKSVMLIFIVYWKSVTAWRGVFRREVTETEVLVEYKTSLRRRALSILGGGGTTQTHSGTSNIHNSSLNL